MQHFQKLGLLYYESKALDVLIKEKLTPKALSKKAGIPLGKVYSVISSLLRKELISETESRPKELYVTNPSGVIGKLIEQKQHEQESLFSELRYLASSIAASRSQPSRFFQIGTALEDNRDIQLRTFKEARHEICQILNIHHSPQNNRSSKNLWEKEIANVIKRGVAVRAIYPSKTKMPTLLQRLPKDKFQVRLLDTDFIRCDIIDEKKVLLKLTHPDPISFGGILFIENEKFARNLQGIFEQFWEQAKDR